MSIDFTNKVAFVTGGGSGIGLATAARFGMLGATVVIADIAVQSLQSAVRRLRDEGIAVLMIKTDVTDEAEVRKAIDSTVEKFGRLDFAANMAGAPSGGGGIGVASALYRRAVDVSLIGTANCLRAQIPALRRSGGGVIVNCSSVGGSQGMADAPFYAAAKHGVNGLTKSAALECAGNGIRVNAIAPGLTRTPMTEGSFGDRLEKIGQKLIPLGRLGEPEDCARAVTWLCSPDAGFITGVILPVDGGQSVGLPTVTNL